MWLKKTNAVPQCVQGLRHSLAAIADVELRTPLMLTNTDSVWFCGHDLELEQESGYLRTLYSCEDCQRRAVTIGHDGFFYTFHWHRRGEITEQLRKLKALHEKTPGVRNPCSFRKAYCTQAVCVWSRVGHGSFFQNPTQPKISGPNSTQPKKVFTRPTPTHHRHLV